MEENYRDRISKYTLRELLDVEASLDKLRFPDKSALLTEEVERRNAAGEYVPQTFTCPHCDKQTISHCDKLNAGIIRCSECGKRVYLDPKRSGMAAFASFIGLIMAFYYQSCWPFVAGLILMMVLKDRWVTFVPKDIHEYRTIMANLIGMIFATLISLSFTVWALLSEASHVPDPRSVFIAVMILNTILSLGFTVYYYRQRKRLKKN